MYLFSHETRHFQQCVLMPCYHHIVSRDTVRENQSLSKFLILISSNVTFVIVFYSDSTLDQEIMLCFLLFYDTSFSPRKTQYTVVDLLSKVHHTQSAFDKPATRVCP